MYDLLRKSHYNVGVNSPILPCRGKRPRNMMIGLGLGLSQVPKRPGIVITTSKTLFSKGS